MRGLESGHWAGWIGLLAAPALVSASAIRFTDVTKKCGIDFAMTCGGTPSREILEVNGGGVALFDYDNDDDLDVFLANGATMADPEHGPGCRLYANRSDGTFEDATQRLGIHVHRWAMGVAVGDYDGDGWDDLYVTCYGPDVLLRNQCGRGANPRFEDVTSHAGVGDPHWGTSAAFGDADGDGDLDLYVANYLAFDVKHPPDRAGRTFKGVPVMAGPQGLTPEPDTLFENLGNGRFRNVTAAWGIVEKTAGYGLGVRFFDADNDGRLDIFVGNDSTENFLFHNRGSGATPRFDEIGLKAGVATNGDGLAQATMGIALGDVDSNGLLDVFYTNFSADTNTLHTNQGKNFFDDRTSQYGLASVSRPFLSWGCGFYDFDSDGDEDLFIASGHVYPETATHAMDTWYEQEPLLFERRGGRFERVTDAGPMFTTRYSARSTAYGDIDGDGDVDIVMTTLNGPVRVFRNDSPLADRLVVELADRPPNRRGYGARIEYGTGAATQRRWITGGGSYQSADAPHAHFGILADDSKQPGTLRVVWPDGKTTQVDSVARNHRIRATREPEGVKKSKLRDR